MELWERPGTRVDSLVLYASRQEVESGNIRPALVTLRKLINPEVAGRVKGRLSFRIRGYEDDPRDLWEIPEARSWLQALNREFPYWFYFMDLGPSSTLVLIAFSLCEYEKVPGGKLIPDPQLQQFLLSGLENLRALSQKFGDTPEEYNRRSREVLRFFNSEDIGAGERD